MGNRFDLFGSTSLLKYPVREGVIEWVLFGWHWEETKSSSTRLILCPLGYVSNYIMWKHRITVTFKRRQPNGSWPKRNNRRRFSVSRNGKMNFKGIIYLSGTILQYCKHGINVQRIYLHDDGTMTGERRKNTKQDIQLTGTHDCDMKALRRFLCPDVEMQLSTVVLCIQECIPYCGGLPHQLITHILRILYRD